MKSRIESKHQSNGTVAAPRGDRNTLGESAFHRMISMERRRSARTRKSFVLMLLDMGEQASMHRKDKQSGLRKVLSTVSAALRETDVVGWYKEDAVVGVMFTEIALDDQNALPATLMARVGATLQRELLPLQFHELSISFHLFAEARGEGMLARGTSPAVYAGAAAGASETAV